MKIKVKIENSVTIKFTAAGYFVTASGTKGKPKTHRVVAGCQSHLLSWWASEKFDRYVKCEYAPLSVRPAAMRRDFACSLRHESPERVKERVAEIIAARTRQNRSKAKRAAQALAARDLLLPGIIAALS